MYGIYLLMHIRLSTFGLAIEANVPRYVPFHCYWVRHGLKIIMIRREIIMNYGIEFWRFIFTCIVCLLHFETVYLGGAIISLLVAIWEWNFSLSYLAFL